MIEIKDILGDTNRGLAFMDFYRIPDQRQWLQVLSNSPKLMSHLPAKLTEIQKTNPNIANIFGVNLNAGCPSPEIMKTGEGAALFQNPERIINMVQAFLGEKESHPFHISVKFRLGETLDDVRQNKFLVILEGLENLDDPRVSASIVNFKYATQTSMEPERWEMLEVVLDAKTPLILNGGISKLKDLEQIRNRIPSRQRVLLWNQYVKGIMMGRAAQENLDIFRTFIKNQQFNKNDITWQTLLKENLKIHPPIERIAQSLKDKYSFLKI
jgi:tRNA-dihydrouridine synthase